MEKHRNTTIPVHLQGDYTEPILIKAKPGEIICEACGKPIQEDQLSNDPIRRAYQKKWNLHNTCDLRKDEEMDRITGMENRFANRHFKTEIDKGTIATEKF